MSVFFILVNGGKLSSLITKSSLSGSNDWKCQSNSDPINRGTPTQGMLIVFFISTDVDVRIFWCTFCCHNHNVLAQVPSSALYEFVIYPNIVLSHGKPVVIPRNSGHWVLINIVGLPKPLNARMAYVHHEVTNCTSNGHEIIDLHFYAIFYVFLDFLSFTLLNYSSWETVAISLSNLIQHHV